MKSNLTAVAVAALVAVAAAPVLARDAVAQAAPQVMNLKDGSTLYVFKDGKMAKEDRFGRAVYLRSGEVLETRDGRNVTAVGNEVARLDGLLSNGHRN